MVSKTSSRDRYGTTAGILARRILISEDSEAPVEMKLHGAKISPELSATGGGRSPA
jgi:hypothetical protein